MRFLFCNIVGFGKGRIQLLSKIFEVPQKILQNHRKNATSSKQLNLKSI